MENRDYDYLQNLSEEDRIALEEIRRKREAAEKDRFEDIMDEVEIKSIDQKIVLTSTLLAAIITVTGFYILATSTKGCSTDTTETTITETKDNDIEVTRNYMVKSGDTLIGISKKSGMSVDDIKEENNLNSDIILPNQKLKLIYTINSDDINYVTDSISVDNRNIYEIAGEYDTDAKSIYALNKESIEKVINNNTINYVVLSDTLLVPNYKTPKDIENAKKLNKNL